MKKKDIITYKDIKSFTIKRSKWLRMSKRTQIYSQMLDGKSGKMCCLGFYSITCGIPRENIKNEPSPRDVVFDYDNIVWNTFLLSKRKEFGFNKVNSKIAGKLMDINDDEETTDDFKEKEIKKIFATKGVKVKFVP